MAHFCAKSEPLLPQHNHRALSATDLVITYIVIHTVHSLYPSRLACDRTNSMASLMRLLASKGPLMNHGTMKRSSSECLVRTSRYHQQARPTTTTTTRGNYYLWRCCHQPHVRTISFCSDSNFSLTTTTVHQKSCHKAIMRSSSIIQSRWFETEREYHPIADTTLETIQDTVEEILDDTSIEFEINVASGVLNFKLPPHGTWVINKQTPNRQIWVRTCCSSLVVS